MRSDLVRMANFHYKKLAELGDPTECAEKWASLILNFPGEWRALVKALSFNSMELDVASKTRSSPGEWGSQPLYEHKCTVCNSTFASLKALQAHERARHRKRTKLASLVGSSKVCPCCHVQFSTRSRLLAHVSEKRIRGARSYSCHTLMSAGLVPAVGTEELNTALAADTAARTEARKAGHTVPISMSLAKRPKTGTSVLEQQRGRKHKLSAGDEVTTLPPNAVFLDELKPLKRVRTKTSQEMIVMQHVI